MAKDRIKLILHYGNIDPWRSINCFLDALAISNHTLFTNGSKMVEFKVMGKIISKEERRKANQVLGYQFSQTPICSYIESRAIAASANYLMVVVSSRHSDNIPSKLIDGFAYELPILLLAKRESAAAALIDELKIGVIADPNDVKSIASGLMQLFSQEQQYIENFSKARSLLTEWSCEKVATSFQKSFFSIMNW